MTKSKIKPKFSIEIDVSDHECDRYSPRWANYGTISAEGNTLDELLANASVDIMDQDGGEIDVVPADCNWMADLISQEHFEIIKDAAADRDWNESNGVYPEGSESIEPRRY